MPEYCLIATAIGPVGLAWSEQGLVRLQLPDSDSFSTRQLLLRRLEATESHSPEWLEPGVKLLQHYFAGTPTDLSGIPIDLAGVPDFHQACYRWMLGLAWGETTTYGALAAAIGSPGAAQSVGRAMGRNPLPIVVPCHRVLASGNKLGGFSAPGGVDTKLWLLEMEGVRLNKANPAQMMFAF